MQEISVTELINEIGVDLYNVNTDFFQKYFDIMEKNDEGLIATVKIIKNIDSSFSVYDKKSGDLVNLICLSVENDYYVYPMGLCSLLSTIALLNLHENNQFINGSIVDDINRQLMSNESMDNFLMYMGIMMIENYGFDIYQSYFDLEDNIMLIDGTKKELALLDGEYGLRSATFIITCVKDPVKVNIIRMWDDDERSEDEFISIPIYDLINKIYNDTIADHKK